MPPRKYARIAITLPDEVLADADTTARAMDRPRSWVVAEAIRQYAAAAPSRSPAPDRVAGIGPSRRAQLAADLRLSPLQRVREAEETVRVTALRRKPLSRRVICFDRYEDYIDWKRSEDARG